MYLQEVKGYSALQAGVAFLPLTAGIIVGAAISQQLIRRLGVKPVLLGGLVMAASGLLWMTGLSPSSTYAGGMLPGLVLIALGMGNTFVPLTLTATTNVENDDQGLASGIFNTAQQIGGAIGVAVVSSISIGRFNHLIALHGQSAFPQAFTSGTRWGFWVCVGISVVGLVAVVVLVRREELAQVEVGEAPALA